MLYKSHDIMRQLHYILGIIYFLQHISHDIIGSGENAKNNVDQNQVSNDIIRTFNHEIGKTESESIKAP